MRRIAALFLIAPAAAWPAFAQEAIDCAVPAPLPAGLEGWRVSGIALTAGDAQSAPVVPIGEGHDVTLRLTDGVAWRHPPERSPRAGSFGGVLTLEIHETGTYRIALAEGLWIDVAGASGVVTSVGHGHGPACSGIRKIVDFRLDPGRYAVQLSGAVAGLARVLVARR